MNTRPPIRIAVVGVGKIARDQHFPCILGNPRFQLVATVSRHGGGEPDGIRKFHDLAGLFSSGIAVDAVALCMPPAARHDIARQAISAGKHVLLEKPPGATLAEVHELDTLAKARGVTLFTAWHSQFAAAVAPLKDWLAARTVTAARITWREDVRHWHPGQDWVWQAGGFGVFDFGINALSIATRIFGYRLRVVAAELDVPANRLTPIAARLTMDLAGAPVAADFDWRQIGPPTWDIAIETGNGAAALTLGGDILALDGVPVALSPRTEYQGVYARFAELVDNGESEVDIAPLTLVADSYLTGAARATDVFI